jgi:2-polyprenyl-3-methyl-5-hydroxy-6-metoxy-1,4-benzoquinol methylase
MSSWGSCVWANSNDEIRNSNFVIRISSCYPPRRMISLNNEPCCICGSVESELAWSTTYPEHGYPGGFDLRRCLGCGLLFNSPRLDHDELAQLYGRSYYFFNRPDSPEFDRAVPMYRRSVALVADQIAQKRTLDIGGGRGYFPALLKRLGWDAKAVEISSDASKYARDKFKLDVFTGTIEQYSVSPEKQLFPLVTAIDVIEHVPDPNAFIAAAAAVMEPGGVLIVDTPNAAAKNIQIEQITWKGFNPFHIFLFNPDNLAKLLAKHGLIVQKRFTYGNIPADRGGRSTISRIGAAARRTLPPVMLGPASKAYFGLRGLGSRDGDPEENLARVSTAAQAPGTYLNSADAKEELAASFAGDNMIVIARKG